MAQIFLPQIRVRRTGVGTTTTGGNQIYVRIPDLSAYPKTYVTSDHAAGVTTLNVISSTGWSANQYILIGELGAEESEIKLATGLAATTFTVSATAFAHARGTVVRFIPFNQVSIESATSLTGSYSEISGSPFTLQADTIETLIVHNSQASTIAYKARFKNAQDTTFSDYSDAVLATGYGDNTVWSVKNRALRQIGEKMDDILTDEFLNEALWEGRRELDQERKRWSFRTAFNTDIGNVTEGAYSVAVPSTLRNPDSPQNILGLRIGNDGRNLEYVSKREFDEWYEGVRHTTVATQPSVGATSLVLTNSRDFDTSGSVVIGSNTITYTANDVSTGTLSGIPASGTGSITSAHAAATDVWQNASFSTPMFYTIFEDTIYFNCPFNDDHDGENIYMDFYRTLPERDSDNDTFDEPDYDMFVSWLKWKIKYRRKNGDIQAETDSDYLEWDRRKKALLKRETLNQKVGFVPSIDHLLDID